MFGSAHNPPSPSKDADTVLSNSPPKPSATQGAISERTPRNSRDEEIERTGERSTSSVSPARSKSTDETNSGGEKKRRSSGIAKAGALFSNARNSLHLPGSPPSVLPSESAAAAQITAIQKLGKTDPALSVPQGSLNNSAGESRPGPRSTFRVGVTEDRNRKCRRTMEDTHAYLYNFLSTPAPSLGSDNESTSSRKSQASKEAPEPSISVIQSSHMVETDNGYFAVFDGHAGTFAADWCGKKLHILLEEMIRKYPNTPIPELLDQTFTSVDQQLEKLPVKNSGCTAITAVLRWEDRIPSNSSATGSTAIAPAAAAAAKAAFETAGGAKTSDLSGSTPHSNATFPGAASVIPKLQDVASRQRVLYTANVGDARIVLCRNGKALRLSYDHKGSDENEGKRISNAGGLILNNRVNGVLAVTRALGDAYLKDLVTGHPYTTETVIQPDIDEFLILACDGVSIPSVFRAVEQIPRGLTRCVQLWDVCSDQEAVDLVRHTHDPQAASKQLVDHALARFSTDNLSCMIVRFDNKALQQTIERRNEPIGVDGDPPSLKKGGISEAFAILREAKKNMDEAGQSGGAEDKTKLNRDTIQEEEEREARPQADRNGIKG